MIYNPPPRTQIVIEVVSPEEELKYRIFDRELQRLYKIAEPADRLKLDDMKKILREGDPIYKMR